MTKFRERYVPLIDEPLTDEEEAAIQAGIAADPDAFEMDEEMFKRARPFREVFPEAYEAHLREREPYYNADGTFDTDRWNRDMFDHIAKVNDVEGAINATMAGGADMTEFEDRVADLDLNVRLLEPKSYEWWMGVRARKRQANGSVPVHIESELARRFQQEGDGWEKALNDTLRNAVFGD